MGRGSFSPDDHGVQSGLLRNAGQNFGRGLGHVLGIGFLGVAIAALGALALARVPDTAFVWHDEQGRAVYGIRRTDTQQRLDQALQKIRELEHYGKTRHYHNAWSGPLYIRAEPNRDARVVMKIPASAGGIVSSCNIEVVGSVVFVEADYQDERGWVYARGLAPSR
ncbi:MAG TPA: hypothetical protein VGQ93_14335 [Lysobacter sp.]|nr:hypothetical protein [Lysobacter sp.]